MVRVHGNKLFEKEYTYKAYVARYVAKYNKHVN